MFYLILTIFFSPVGWSIFLLKKVLLFWKRKREQKDFFTNVCDTSTKCNTSASINYNNPIGRDGSSSHCFTKKLVIATAKIGDYFNQSVIFPFLESFDIVISPVNVPIARQDPRIKKIYNIGEYRQGILKKIQLGFKLSWEGYREVYILVPNSYNLFLGKSIKGAKVKTIHHYNQKWWEILLMVGMERVNHQLENLTIESYLKLVGVEEWKKGQKSVPIVVPKRKIEWSGRFKVGISVSAGNRLKNLPIKIWEDLFKVLEKYPVEYHLFGAVGEEKFGFKISQMDLKNPTIWWIGKVGVEELPYFISHMNLYISSDSGNSYIADTYRIPVITFAGPCFMGEQRPVGDRVLIIPSISPCVPFSFIFKAPYSSPCGNPFQLPAGWEKKLEHFLKTIVQQQARLLPVPKRENRVKA